jgi:hypothetical protein
MKRCSKCKESKPFIEYSKNKTKKDGLKDICKSCAKIERGEYVERKKKLMGDEAYKDMLYEKARGKRPDSKKYNRDNIDSAQKRKLWYEKNKERLNEYNKLWREKNKERQSMSIYSWSRKNKRGIRKHGEAVGTNEYMRRLYIEKPELKLARICASNIKRYLNTKREKYYEIIGCTNHELKIYLEQKFLEGMSWDNHGKWHIDHIIPLCTAKNKQEAIALNHYTNLQPLWAQDNLRKSKRV